MAQSNISSAQKNIPAARVNGVTISQYQLESGVAQLLKPYADVKGKVRVPQEQQYAARKAVLENLIMRELLYQEAGKRGIKATGEEINTATQQVIAEYGAEREFKAMLVMTGSSPDEFRSQLIKDLTVNKMAAAVVEGKRKPVSAEEARKYYDEHKAEMQGPEVRWLVHIMVPLDQYATPDEAKKAREPLEKIRSLRPAEFEKRARTEGEDLGYVMRGQLHPVLDSVVFNTPAGQISRIVKTEEGLHVVLVKEILEAGKVRPFNAAVEKELIEKLYESRSVSMLHEFTKKLHKKAEIEILDHFVDTRLEMEKPEGT
jgi:peptidyl-prolyl cis-trans isomerase C